MKVKLLAAVAALVILGSGAIALASIPGPDGVISGCYQNSTGNLKVIDSAESCPSGYTALNWNQTGPAGPPGVSGVHLVVVTEAPQTGTITCPTGEVALSGAINTTQGVIHPVVNGNNPPVSYQFAFASSSTYTAYLTCGEVAA